MTANEVLVSPGEGSNAIVTHGILLRPGIRVRASSSGLGWRGIAASVQSELPFSGSYDAVSDHLVVLHVGRPARVAGRTAGKLVDKMIPPGHFFLWPGGQSFNVELRDPLETVHLYVKRDLVDAIAREFGFGKVELEPSLGEIDTLIQALVLEVRRTLCAARACKDGPPAIRISSRVLERSEARRFAFSGLTARALRRSLQVPARPRNPLKRIPRALAAAKALRVRSDIIFASCSATAARI